MSRTLVSKPMTVEQWIEHQLDGAEKGSKSPSPGGRALGDKFLKRAIEADDWLQSGNREEARKVAMAVGSYVV